jgi:hypothetical protein
MVTWNTGEASKLYEQNYTPTAREKAQPKERMLDDMSDILLPTFIDYVSDLIIVSTQEMSVAKKRYINRIPDARVFFSSSESIINTCFFFI